MKVLVVEDSQTDLVILRHSFAKHAEITPTFVSSLLDAKANAAGNDLVLLDLHLEDSMPEETIEWMRVSGIPTIVMSGSDDPEFVKKAVANGALNYIQKSAAATDQLWVAMLFTLADWEQTTKEREHRKDKIKGLICRLMAIRDEKGQSNADHTVNDPD